MQRATTTIGKLFSNTTLTNETVFSWSWIFSEEKFKIEKIAICCKTIEESNKFLRFLESYTDIKVDRKMNMSWYTYEANTCYIYFNNRLQVANRSVYDMISYKKYPYSIIDFKRNPQIEIPIITKDELIKRGFYNGDIIRDKDGEYGIIYDDCIAYITSLGWDDIHINKLDAILLAEKIKENDKIHLLLSQFLYNKNTIPEEFKKLFMSVVKSKNDIINTTIVGVEFTPNGKIYDFITTDMNILINDIVECNTKNGTRKYAKVKTIKQKILTKQEYSSEYKFCRPTK